MTISWLPVIIIDIFGSAFTLCCAIICLFSALSWANKKHDDIFRHYIFLLTCSIVFFAVSRSFGHIIKQILILSNLKWIWKNISPFSGAINSATFIVVFAFGIYFNRIRKIYLNIIHDKDNLEVLVENRTQELKNINIQLQQEIIEHKASEKLLKKQEEQYRLLVETLPQGVQEFDLNGIITFTNRAHDEIIGYKHEEIIGKSVWSFEESKASQEKQKEYFAHLIKEQPKPNVFFIKNKRKDGSIIDLQVDWNYVRDNNDKLIGFIAIISDITERKKIEMQLHQTQKMQAIGTLAGGIAHDFNNILAPILGYAELVLEHLPENTDDHHHQSELIKAVNRAKRLISQILTFAHKKELKFIPVQIHLIIDETLTLLRSSIPASVKMVNKIEPDCGFVLGDPVIIQQILINLITNAYQAMQDNGGIISISLSKINISSNDSYVNLNLNPGIYLKLEISDSGSGISPEIQDKIFEPYFTTREVGRGTGLGLSVVHGIVNKLHGKIDVYSESGKGTTFSIYLPQIETLSAKKKTVFKKKISKGTESILIVDDEPAIIKMIQQILQKLGYRVISFTSSAEALNIFQKQSADFDLIITDNVMPDINGIELSKKILAIKPDMPVILCSEFSELINREQAKTIGIHTFFTKPINIADLMVTIRNILDKEKLKGS